MTAAVSSRQRVFSAWDAVSVPSARNAGIAVALALAAAAIVAALVLASDPTYRSRTTLAIDQPGAIARSADTGVIEKLDRLRLKYAGLADTAPVAGEVARALRMDAGDVRDRASVVVGTESLLLFPTATGSSAAEAERLSQALADRLREYAADEQAGDGIPEPERFVLEEVEPASAGEKISPTNRGAVALGGFTALAAFGMAYVALQVATAERRMTAA